MIPFEDTDLDHALPIVVSALVVFAWQFAGSRVAMSGAAGGTGAAAAAAMVLVLAEHQDQVMTRDSVMVLTGKQSPGFFGRRVREGQPRHRRYARAMGP